MASRKNSKKSAASQIKNIKEEIFTYVSRKEKDANTNGWATY